MHVSGIGVAARAEIRGLIFLGSPAKAFGAAHGVQRFVVGIATMAIGTTQTGLMMDIDLELLGGFGEIPLERRVAGNAGVFGWSGPGDAERE